VDVTIRKNSFPSKYYMQYLTFAIFFSFDQQAQRY